MRVSQAKTSSPTELEPVHALCEEIRHLFRERFGDEAADASLLMRRVKDEEARLRVSIVKLKKLHEELKTNVLKESGQHLIKPAS